MSALGDRALDPSPLLGALEGEVPGSGVLVSLDGHLGQLGARIGRNLRGLAPAMRWLLDHRPGPGGARAICHGDFHPQNLLFDGREITAVLDWPNVLVTDPAYDVAATRVILEQAPLEVLPVSRPARWTMAAGRRLLVALYLRGYRRRRPLAARALAYYEAGTAVQEHDGRLLPHARVLGHEPGALDVEEQPDAVDPHPHGTSAT